MINTFQFRNVIILMVLAPLAILIGLLLTHVADINSILILGMLFSVLCLPLVMRWHHLFLVISWNGVLQAFFLPGQPALWMVMAFLSLFFSFWNRTLNREHRLIIVPQLLWPLICLAVIVIFTAMIRGGIGLNAFGSSMIGAKRYVAIISAIAGFFALSCQSIPRKRAVLYASLFFLSGITAVFCDLIYAAGPGFYWLFLAFPPELAKLQAVGEQHGQMAMFRLEGVAWGAVALFCFMLVRYGVKGILDIRQPWRIALLLVIISIGLLGGFRSRLLLMISLFCFQFLFEGLWRTCLFPIVLGIAIIGFALLATFADQLPQPVQRSLSFLPVKIDPAVQKDAEATLQWRFEMWHVLSQEVSKYFWLGKGYTFSATDLYLTQQAELRGLTRDYESMVLVGEYHNGFFSAILPFGIFGLLAFVWLLCTGWWVLFCNYRHGDLSLKNVNTFLLAFFTVKCIFFFVVYGSLYLELALFTGVLGLSISLNGGVRRLSKISKHSATPPVETIGTSMPDFSISLQRK